MAYAVGRELGLPMSTSRDYILHWHGTVEGLEAPSGASRAAREILKTSAPAGKATNG